MKKRAVVVLIALLIALSVFSACGGEKYYSVVFNMCGAQDVIDSPDTQTVRQNGFAIRPAVSPSSAGKVFVDWYDSESGSARFDFSAPIRSNTVVYARWRAPATFTLNFDANGVSAEALPETQNIAENTPPNEPVQSPKAIGKTFAGWYTTPECIQKFDFTEKLNSDRTAYAKWADATGGIDFGDIEYRSYRGQNGITDAKTPENVNEITFRWELKLATGWENTSWPIEVGEYLYVVSENNRLNRVGKYTGEVLRSCPLSRKIGYFSSLTYGDGKIFVPLSGGVVEAFDEETMQPLWRSKIPTDVQGNPLRDMQSICTSVYHNGYLYTGVTDASGAQGAFFCLSAADKDASRGDEEKDFTWIYAPKDRAQAAAGGFYWSGAAIVGNSVLFGGEEGVLYAHSLTGNEKDASGITVFQDVFPLERENESIPESIRSSVLYDARSERIYVTTKAGSVHSIRVGSDGVFDRTSYLRTFLGQSLSGTPTAYRGRLYVGGGGIGAESGLCVLDANTLKTIYRTNIQTQSSPIVCTAYAAPENNYKVYVYVLGFNEPDGIYILEDFEGKTQADAEYPFIASKRPQYNSSSLMISREGMFYYKNDSGYLFAYGSKFGYEYTAEDVSEKIKLLPAPFDFSLAEKQALLQTQCRYALLTEREKKNVTGADKLNSLLERLRQLEIADASEKV